MSKSLVLFGFALLFSLCLFSSTFSQGTESLTITTYYPSPYGSYRELETQTLFFRETANGLISFKYPDTTYDRRLRITAGLADTSNNDQGASIDLHGNSHANAGRLDLVAGRGGDITFWTSPAGNSALERMIIASTGNVGIGTASPQSKFQVAGGGVQLGNDAAVCNASKAGTIRYTAANVLEYCNGTAPWQPLGGASVPAGTLAGYCHAAPGFVELPTTIAPAVYAGVIVGCSCSPGWTSVLTGTREDFGTLATGEYFYSCLKN